jgi:iron complex transport system substrate-binding protein
MPVLSRRRRRSRHRSRSPRRARWALLLGIVGVALMIAGCGSSSSSSSTSPSGSSGSGGSGGSASTAAAAAATTAAPQGATVINCGVKVHVAKPPTKAISLNQGATELMLTLGLQKSMIGTAYLDDHVLPSLQKAYNSVPVLSKEYPSAESFLAKQPDFAIASYTSAFSAKEGVGTRSSLQKLGIATYLLPDGCPNAKTNVPWTFADDFAEIRQVGALFGIQARAQHVIAQQKAALKQAVGTGPLPGKGVRILWWDSDDKSPVIGACCGGPNLIMKTVGATNVFSGVKGNWQNVDWEAAIAAKPQVIVLINASWDTLQSKLKYIQSNPALQALPAVQHKRYVVIPFSDSTPGVRNVEAVKALAAGLRKLHLNG